MKKDMEPVVLRAEDIEAAVISIARHLDTLGIAGEACLMAMATLMGSHIAAITGGSKKESAAWLSAMSDIMAGACQDRSQAVRPPSKKAAMSEVLRILEGRS